MDETKAVAILSVLAQGVNPFTGEIAPADSPYQHAEVVRALYAAIDRLQQRAAPKQRQRTEPPSNVGKPWAEDEDRRLVEDFDRGRTPADIARDFGRTLAGIEARLEKHGRLNASERRTANRYARDR